MTVSTIYTWFSYACKSDDAHQPLPPATNLYIHIHAMEKRKEHPIELRRLCVYKWKQGMSNGMISEHLDIPVTSVKGIIVRYQRHGHSTDGRRTGRPRATKAITDRAIVREVERNRLISVSVLAAQRTRA